MKILHVKWRDSCFQFQQQTMEDAKDFTVSIMESVGFLVHEDSDRIALAGDFVDGSDVRQVTSIPQENVIKRTVLRK